MGVALSALTFVLVSRMTTPTPPETLRIFFDDVTLPGPVTPNTRVGAARS